MMMYVRSLVVVAALFTSFGVRADEPSAADIAIKDAIELLRGRLEKAKGSDKERIAQAIKGLQAELKQGAVGNAVTLDTKELIDDFSDNTKRYKGKTITIDACYLGVDNKLREGLPGQKMFYNPSVASVTVKVKVEKEDAENVPNAVNGDRVILTFLCEEGRVDFGNKLVAVKRR
jgi:hypothetical protein